MLIHMFFFFSSRRRHTRWTGDWSSDVCSSDLRGRGRDDGGQSSLAYRGQDRRQAARHRRTSIGDLGRGFPRGSGRDHDPLRGRGDADRPIGEHRTAGVEGQGQGDGARIRRQSAQRFSGRCRGGRAMMAFDWAEPETLKDAVALLDPDDASVRAVAGGTALMLMMKAGVFQPTRLISLAKIEPHYSQIRIEKDGALKVGAMTTLTALEQSVDVAALFP